MCIKENQEKKNPTFCQWCGRIVYQNVKTGRIGCRNTKCRGYLVGSKNLSEDILRQVKR